MLVLVIMISWIGSILEIRSMERNSDIILQSVLSEQGIRWFIRNAAACFSTAPAGEALMILMAMGIGQGSGYFRALRRMRLLSPKERVSLIISMVVLLLYILFIVMDFLFGSYSLLGVSGTLKGSPMAEGAVFLCMLAIALPATVYGISVGSIRFHVSTLRDNCPKPDCSHADGCLRILYGLNPPVSVPDCVVPTGTS
jgi:p-aminobenzoyl-glutamate transporter AbgT